MRTACVQVALTFALLCAPPVTPQTAEDGSRVQAETPARQKRPTRTGQPVQPAPGQSAVERPAYGIQNYSPLAAAGGYKRQQQTFWEFWWHQFNPRNINYGAWIEQRRRVFLEQAGENRYFWFSFWAFATICFLLLWGAKERMDRKDTEWEAAECLADLANYADYCKRHALEAIQKHNEHIEVCNRVIESEETGKPVMAGDVDGDWKAEVQRLRTEVAEKSAEVVKLSAALEQKSAAVTNLNERIDELARNQRAGGNAANANLDLVKRLNDLTSENHKLREELCKLKRAT